MSNHNNSNNENNIHNKDMKNPSKINHRFIEKKQNNKNYRRQHQWKSNSYNKWNNHPKFNNRNHQFYPRYNNQIMYDFDNRNHQFYPRYNDHIIDNYQNFNNRNHPFYSKYDKYDQRKINNKNNNQHNMFDYCQFPPMYQFIPFYDNPFPTLNENVDKRDLIFNNINRPKTPDFSLDGKGGKIKDNLFKSMFRDIFPERVKQDDIQKPIINNKFTLDPNKDYKILNKKIETIEDFIEIGKLYDPDIENEYPIDLKRVYDLIDPLTELNNMVGIDHIKQNILELIIYGIQDLTEDNMYHTIIQGPPGIGKTMLGMILAKIYHALGIIENNEKDGIINPITGKKENFVIKVYRRSDLIGKYLGHTAAKTQEAIDSCKGGVMFIDEAYSLGNSEGRDSYSKECIDTINQNLSENKNKFICIIAGYPDQIENCFLAYNEGLRRRFSFKYTIDKYSPSELCEILKRKIHGSGWKILDNVSDDKLEKYIKIHISDFENYGGDMETLLLNCKLVHSWRLFGKHPNERKKLSFDDIKNGYKRFVSHKHKQQNEHSLTMYS
jgi:SpoVK/Ycf46/Vps4 family AAA+-type ATPase